jgi:hypothetical protein
VIFILDLVEHFDPGRQNAVCSSYRPQYFAGGGREYVNRNWISIGQLKSSERPLSGRTSSSGTCASRTSRQGDSPQGQADELASLERMLG